GAIQEVQLSPNRLLLLVRTTIGIYGYNVDRLEEVWRWEYPSGIAAMAVPRLERWIAAATNDGRIALLIYQRGSMFTQWVSGYEEITDLAFSYDGEMLAAIGDKGVTVWQVGETEPLYAYPEIKGTGPINFTPDGTNITYFHNGDLMYNTLSTGEITKNITIVSSLPTYSKDSKQATDGHTIWNTDDGEIIVELEIPDGLYPTDISAFSQNGKYLAAVGDVLEDIPTIGIWQADTGKLLFTLQSPLGIASQPRMSGKLAAPSNLSGPTPNYSRVEFSPDGRILAAAHPNGYVDLWNLDTNEFMYRYSDLGDNLIFRKASRLTIWDEIEIRDIEPHNGILINSSRDFTAGRLLHFSPDQRWLFADWVVWDMANLQRSFRLGYEIVGTISTDEEYLFSYDEVHRIINQRRLNDLALVEQVELAWDFGEPDVRLRFKPPGYQISAFSISPNGDYISIRIHDYGTQTWNVSKNEIVPDLSKIYTMSNFYSSNDNKVIFSDSDNAYIYQLKPEVKQLDSFEAQALCGVSPDGTQLIAENDNNWYLYSEDSSQHYQQEKILDIPITQWLCTAAFQEKSLLAVTDSNSLILVDKNTGMTLLEITAHLDRIASLAFSPDGKYLATSSYDGTVKLWGIPPEQ
ncbi:MAG TPA: WD40 repeat domain-containing protein, partial [Anaerolineales bacterium]|nr:WD40 repeat domain-containing protein [Anaerolineales bacterium]